MGLLNTPSAFLQRGKILPHESAGYDTKQNVGEAPEVDFFRNVEKYFIFTQNEMQTD